MLFRIRKIERNGRVALTAQISEKARPHVWEMSAEEFAQIGDWRKAIAEDYRRELRERAALAGPDVFEIVRDAISPAALWRNALAAASIIVLMVLVCVADSPKTHGASDAVIETPVTDFVKERSGGEDERLARFFDERASAHDAAAIPKAVIYARRRQENARGVERQSTAAARNLLARFTDDERRAACVRYADTVGRLPADLLRRLEEVFAP